MLFKEAISHLTSTVKLVNLCDKLKIDVIPSGDGYSSICQFHNDTHPSMHLYDNNEQGGSRFHCYACNAHGNIYELVKQVKGLDFQEAVQWLAKEYGVQITYSTRNKKTPKKDLLTTILNDVYGYVLKLYQENQNTKLLENFINGRGFESEIITLANLCVTNHKNFIVSHLSKLLLDDPEKLILFDEFEKKGLIKKSLFEVEKNQYLPLIIELQQSYYDHFSPERILFPIQNEIGLIQGFAGRLINNDTKGPKYLFTKGLKKSELLYRSVHAFSNIKTTKTKDKLVPLYLCEGLFDALRLESCGLNAVAILGADLSKTQTDLICNLASQLKNKALCVSLFFDNDNAGIKATANAIQKLFRSSDPGSLELKVIHADDDNQKIDPDSYLKNISIHEVESKIAGIEYPLPTIFLADKMAVSTKLIRENLYWNDLPYSQRFRAAIEWNKIFDDTNRSPKDTLEIFQTFQKEAWYIFLTSTNSNKNISQVNVHGCFLTETQEKIQHAIKLAESSGISSALPNDISEWRRLNMCSIALELIIEDRFNSLSDDLSPIEPLNSIKASRKIADNESRIMHMHCAEDLISHQYILNELLTESHDNYIINRGGSGSKRLSDCIPVTRFYEQENKSVTTGNGREDTILSFAYQISMNILEGGPSKKEGMFRPYFDSWKCFTTSIATAANKMPLVHMVRLDLKRYYDRLKRFAVQDALREHLPEDIFENPKFASLIKGKENRTRDNLINWLLEQSFGYDYYDPKTGDIKTSDPLIGIPQGPDLSSFLANLVLFKVDEVARKFIEKEMNNESGYNPAWYARYVDDMVVIADSAITLARFRAKLEDAVKELELEIVAKEQPGAKGPEEFLNYLGKGKALATSGPMGVEPIIDLDAIKFIDKIERFQALALLNDKNLYSEDSTTIIKKVNMAANSESLRLTDLRKITKWLWYAVTLQELEKSSTQDPSKTILNFVKEWKNVAVHFNSQLSPLNCHWEDPMLIALDGLKSSFEDFDWISDELTELQKRNKNSVRTILVNLVTKEFIEDLSSAQHQSKIIGWGISKDELARTYWQKITYLIWEAEKLSTRQQYEQNELDIFINPYNELSNSLWRLKFTHAEIKSSQTIVFPEKTNSSDLTQICNLLQEIYYHLGINNQSCLSNVTGKIEALSKSFAENKKESKAMQLFSLLVPKGNA